MMNAFYFVRFIVIIVFDTRSNKYQIITDITHCFNTLHGAHFKENDIFNSDLRVKLGSIYKRQIDFSRNNMRPLLLQRNLSEIKQL